MSHDGSITLFRARGVPVRAHWTLLLVLPYLAFVLSREFESVAGLAGVPAEQLALPPLLWGLVLAIGLFASIALHELAHTFVALGRGGRVRSITLMLVGGVSQLVRAPARARDEASMAAAGPATSLALGAGLYLAYVVSAGLPADLQMMLFYLGGMNVTLGLFNLIPAFPMDGGRLFRAALAAKLGRGRATRIAATVGKLCAVAFGALALWSGNLLLVLIAVFVYSGAQAEASQEQLRSQLGGLRVADLVGRRSAPVIGLDHSSSAVLPEMRRLDRLELLALAPTGPKVILPADVADLTPSERWSTTVGDLAARLPDRSVCLAASATANDAVERMAEAGVEYAVVTDELDRVVGLIAADDIGRAIKLGLARPAEPYAV